MGLLDKYLNAGDNRHQALTRAGLAMLAASGPQKRKVGLGQILSAGGTAYMDERDKWRDQQVKKLQYEALQRKAAQEKRRQEGMERFRGLLNQGPPPANYQDTSLDEGYDPALNAMNDQVAQAQARYPNDLKSAMFQAAPSLALKSQYDMALAKAKRGAGPFQGTALQTQILNTLLTDDPGTQQYAAAYAHYSRPKTYQDPNTGLMTTVMPDMSSFKKPTFSGAPGQFGPQTTQVRIGSPVLSEAQSKAIGFYNRMTASNKTLEEVAGAGANLFGRLAEQFPGGNYLQSPEYQRFEQARRDFINAQLRRESGAVINPSEFENADRQYFPVPGDGPEVIAQKARNRKIAIQNMRRSGTPGYKEPEKKTTQTGARIKATPAQIGKMSLDELANMDASKMNEAQKRAWWKAWKKAGGA